jgi:molecular chaperone GrpE
MIKKNSEKKDKQQEEISILKNQLARALADYDNLQKRIEKERELLQTVAGLALIKRLLPLLDMLNDAQKHLQDSGLAITINEFVNALKEEGVTQIEAKPATSFDTNFHEAVEVVEGENGKIVEEVLTGWKFNNGPVIRPAKVKVGKMTEETK